MCIRDRLGAVNESAAQRDDWRVFPGSAAERPWLAEEVATGDVEGVVRLRCRGRQDGLVRHLCARGAAGMSREASRRAGETHRCVSRHGRTREPVKILLRWGALCREYGMFPDRIKAFLLLFLQKRERAVAVFPIMFIVGNGDFL